MLSAKTNTTCREKDTNRRNDFNADGVPTAPQLILLPPVGHRTSRLHMTASSVCSTDHMVSSVHSNPGCTADGCACRLRHRVWRLPSADMLSTTTLYCETVSQWVHWNQPRLPVAADDRRCNHNHLHKELTSAGTMPLPSFFYSLVSQQKPTDRADCVIHYWWWELDYLHVTSLGSNLHFVTGVLSKPTIPLNFLWFTAWMENNRSVVQAWNKLRGQRPEWFLHTKDKRIRLNLQDNIWLFSWNANYWSDLDVKWLLGDID